VPYESSYYLDRLLPSERVAYHEAISATTATLAELGFPSMEIGKDYSVSDYLDRVHFTENGGRRIAEEVAPKVRELAVRLGYRKQPGSMLP
jgi:hypothetical protein